MIQRKQSLWLLLAVLSTLLIFKFPVFSVSTSPSPVSLMAAGDFVSLIFVSLMVLLPALTLFLYKDRKKQLMLSLLSIVAALAFIAANLAYISRYRQTSGLVNDGHYGVGSLVPILVILFLFLAIRGIRSDDKLVKSLERFR